MKRNSLATHQSTNPEPTVKRSGLSRKTPMIRSGFMRKRKPFEPKNGPSDTTLDDLCRDVVFARDGYACTKCDKLCVEMFVNSRGANSYPDFDWSHLISRRYKSICWDPENSMVHCKGCHLWWGDNPDEAMDWFKAKYPGRVERVRARKNAHSQAVRTIKLDRGLILLSLQQQLRALGK